MEVLEILDLELLNNTVFNYLFSFVLLFVFFLLFQIFQKIVLIKFEGISKKTKTDIDNIIVQIIKKIRPPFYFFLSFYLSLKFLNIHSFVSQTLNAFLIIWITYQVIIGLHIVVDYVVPMYFLKEKDEGTKYAIKSVANVFKWALWLFGLLLVFSNLGINITSLIAGLGIGGLAVAIALQNILSDLFSSFAIYFDRPFTVGDFIVVGNNMGIVEKIGLKTTRIRALQGEEVVISNNELISSRIQNFKKMKERRVVFKFGVEYSTPLKKLKKISEIVRKIIVVEKLARFDRAHFMEFSDSSLNFEIVYYILSSDYNDFMNTHQSILFQVKENLEKENISMAFPSRTVYLKKD